MLRSLGRFSLLFITIIFVLSNLLYAGIDVQFNQTTGRMDINVTGGYNVVITKDPITGGLAINGTWTGYLASLVKDIHIVGDNTDNTIDLSGMKPEDFPELDRLGVHIWVEAGGGNDIVHGPPFTAYMWGGDGDDLMTCGGGDITRIYGGDGNDELIGKGRIVNLSGGKGNDLIISGEGTKNYISGGEGDDTIHGNGSDVSIDGGEGNDTVTILGIPTSPGKLLFNNKPLTKTLTGFDSDSTGLYIDDSTGIDTLSFKNFNKGIKLDLNLLGAQQIYTNENDTLTLNTVFEYFVGSPFDDVINIAPDNDSEKNLKGGGSAGGDTLYVDDKGVETSDNGESITFNGYQSINYYNFDQCVLTNTLGIADFNNTYSFRLNQNYPNPFNPSTIISYEMQKESNVEITLVDLKGKEIRRFTFNKQNAGHHQLIWNGRNQNGLDMAGGVYLYTIKAGNNIQTKKMVLLK